MPACTAAFNQRDQAGDAVGCVSSPAVERQISKFAC
jgi:hypothetical protein